MLDLSLLPQLSLNKLEKTLVVIDEAFDIKEKNVFSIPKTDFKARKLSYKDVEYLIEKISTEENKLIKLAISMRPIASLNPPTSASINIFDGLTQWTSQERENQFKQKLKDYNDHQQEYFDLEISNLKELRLFIDRVKTEQKNRTLLTCGDLTFNPVTGEANYFKVHAKFTLGRQEFIILNTLLRRKSEPLHTDKLSKLLEKTHRKKDTSKKQVKAKSSIISIVRNIKDKLAMTPRGALKNGLKKPYPNLFEGKGLRGYRIISKKP